MGHAHVPNRAAKREAHTACMRVCASAISWPPNLHSSFVMCHVPYYPHSLTGGNTAGGGAGQHCLIRSAPSRPADIAVAQNDLPPSCATGPGPVAHPASRSMICFPLKPSMIRPAADETTTSRWASAGPSRHAIRRKWTGSVCEVNSFQCQRLRSLQGTTA